MAAFALIGCTPEPLPARPQSPEAESARARFLLIVRIEPGLQARTDADLVAAGEFVCVHIGNLVHASPQQLESAAAALLSAGYVGDVDEGEALASASSQLCLDRPPVRTPAWPRTSTVPTAATPAPAPVAAGPARTITDGTYEVGVDVEPGKYRTPGASFGCYWARLKRNDGSVGDIIDNNAAIGPQITTLRAGEYFETQGCGTWRKAG
ncbi:hypothetical protein [Pseudonocardia sp.]|uniref:hypothetical protein n=1 Tax=Pseudonocardia sp. TaxID=60912 RepID=UPI003D125477